MVKLKNLSGKNVEDCPDHLIQEIQDLAIEVGGVVCPVIDGKQGNVVLSAINFMHCAIIKKLISDDREQLENAIKNECIALWKNMQKLIEIMEKEQGK